MSGGFIGRIAKYPRSSNRDDRENRLTEVFAAVLASQETQGLAQALAEEWLTQAEEWLIRRRAEEEFLPSPADAADIAKKLLGTLQSSPTPWTVSVQTQTTVIVGAEIRRPDLMLIFSRQETQPRQITLLIEVKHGTGPHDHQMAAYEAWLQDDEYGAVLLLAPRAQLPFGDDEVPASVPQLSWQATGRALASLRGRFKPVGKFLIDELCEYLREEHLMDPKAITPLLLVALEHRREADDAIEQVQRIASADLAGWTGVAVAKPEPYGPDFWERVPRCAPKDGDPEGWPRDCWWEWYLKMRDLGPDSRGEVPVFTAGLAADLRRGQIAGDASGAAWAAELEKSHGFMRFDEYGDKRARFIRYIYPDEVLIGRTLEEQAHKLGIWLIETFEALYHAGPPPAGAA